MNLFRELRVPQRRDALRQVSLARPARRRNTRKTRTILGGLLVLSWPLAAAFAQTSSSSHPSSSSSQQSSTPTQTQSQAPPATLDAPPQKQDSLAEAARKAKANKPATAKPKVYTEDDLKGMKGPGISVVGDEPRKGPRHAQPTDPNGDDASNAEASWRARAQQFLDAIAQTDEQIAQKKEEIRKFGSAGFDVTTGMKNNIAYINDRNAQLKQLEARRADLVKQFEELQDEGRKAGVPSSWFR
jgi:hypothetical protein